MVNRLTEHLDVSVVAGDDATGIERTVDHLVELGHRDIAHVAGPLTSRPAPSGCGRSGRRCSGTGCRDDRIVEAEAYSEAAGRTALLQLLDGERPTAVVAGNDLLALGCYDALDEAGLSCPGRRQHRRLQRHAVHLPAAAAADLGAGAAVRARRGGGPAAARPAQRPHA